MVHTQYEAVLAGRAQAASFSRAAARALFGKPAALTLAALVLAGCASRFPAPIVHRAPGTAAEPVLRSGPPPLVTQPPLAGATSPDIGPVAESVQTAPIRSSSIESRPLAGAPISPSGDARGSAVRTEPNAAKRPYSDQLLAQMRKSPPRTETTPAATGQPGAASSSPPSKTQASARGFVWPASGEVIQRFGGAGSTGLSIAGNPGDPVVAAADGRVIFSGRGPRGYGNLVIVKHDDDTLSVYGHNRALLVKEGTSVKRGQRIAELGDSDADRPKLHFEIRKDSKPVDPAPFLPSR